MIGWEGRAWCRKWRARTRGVVWISHSATHPLLVACDPDSLRAKSLLFERDVPVTQSCVWMDGECDYGAVVGSAHRVCNITFAGVEVMTPELCVEVHSYSLQVLSIAHRVNAARIIPIIQKSGKAIPKILNTMPYNAARRANIVKYVKKSVDCMLVTSSRPPSWPSQLSSTTE